MNPSSDHAWHPDPELLAAYFDGELEGRDDVADVCARIESWLETNPDAAQHYADHQHLKELWRDTTPAEPSATVWKETLEYIDEERRQPVALPPARRPWFAAAVVAASILLVTGLLFGGMRVMLPKQGAHDNYVKAPGVLDDDVMRIATADEITIFRIEGSDTDAFVVGTMPVCGPLELAASGDVCISCKCPRVVVRQDPPHRPMVYARAD